MTGSNAVVPAAHTAPHDRRCPPAGVISIIPEPISYVTGWAVQSRYHQERMLDLRPDTVLILEHQPVYTLGRSTRVSHWGGSEDALRANGTELHCVNRGGSVTYHGPGQIVLYPILRLAQHAKGPKQLVWMLEEVIIRLLYDWQIDGCRIDGKPGVWVMTPEPAKVASIGIRVERGITLHGFALNVDMDLTPFQLIHPCGFTDLLVTSMATLLGMALPVNVVKCDLARIFGTVFLIEWPSTVENLDDRFASVAGETTHLGKSIR